MRSFRLAGAVAVASLCGALSLPALAHDHLGTPARGAAYDREITLAPGARYLNVTQNETVKINIGGNSFVWRFDTLNLSPFDLGEIAPGGVDTAGVRVYVFPDPRRSGGS